MQSTAYQAVRERIPVNLLAGRSGVIRTVLDAGMTLKQEVNSISMRDDLTPKGRAPLVEKHVQQAAALLTKAKRQLAHVDRQVARKKDALRTKVIGEAKPTDAEWRTFLRSLPLEERTQRIFSDPVARGAALREPGLSGLDPERIEHVIGAALQEVAPNEVATLVDEEEGKTLHQVAVQFLADELMQTPFILEPSGNVRKFESPTEFENYINKNVPAPLPRDIALEEAVVDRTE